MKGAAEPFRRGDPEIDTSAAEDVSEPPADGHGRGPGAGFAQALSLFWKVPRFWRLAIFQFFSCAGALPNAYYLGPLMAQVWGNRMTKYALWLNAGQFAVATVGAPLFGTWSDGRSRKVAMVISSAANFARLVPYMFLGSSASGLYGSCIVCILTAPFVAQLSGGPVLWAWMTDIIPQEHRETGFSLISCVGCLAAWSAGIVVHSLATAFGWHADVYMWLGAAFLFIAILVVAISPRVPPQAREEDLDPPAQQKSLAQQLISPFRLVARKRNLGLICGLAAFVTLPDVAVTYVAQPIVFTILNISSADGDNPELQAKVANWFSNFPTIIMIFVFAAVGVCAKRFGPARVLAVWTPVTCCLFAAPALFALSGPDNPPLEIFCGVALGSPISVYPTLQALVARVVPASRVGEAMGAVAACKNLASFIAPLAMSAVVEMLGDSYNLYWTFFPGAALLMLCGAWPFALMVNTRLGGGTEVDMQWSVWSDADGSTVRCRASAGARG